MNRNANYYLLYLCILYTVGRRDKSVSISLLNHLSKTTHYKIQQMIKSSAGFEVFRFKNATA
ncbi:hypothetical protein IFVP22_C210412 [Vibrio parahaemolyticus]